MHATQKPAAIPISRSSSRRECQRSPITQLNGVRASRTPARISANMNHSSPIPPRCPDISSRSRESHEQHFGITDWRGIRQRQTGADRLTIGGAIGANIHGRVLTSPPFVDDLESL